MTIALANEHRQVLNNIKVLAINDTLTLINAAKDLPFVDFRDAMIDGVPAISSQYGGVAGLVSAQYYDLTRARAQTTTKKKYSNFSASSTDYDIDLLDETLEGSVNHGLRKLFYGDLGLQAATALITGAVAKNIFDHSRENIVANSELDNAVQLYTRVPSSNACAWCSFKAVMVDSGQIETTISDEGFHNNCSCVVGVSFDGESSDKFRQAFYDEYQNDYNEALDFIQSGEAGTKVVQKGTADYENLLRKDITSASRDFRKNSERYKSMSPSEKTKFRVNLENKSAQIASKINQNIPLTDLDQKILEGWNYTVPESITKPITTNAKDVLSIMRQEFGYR
jgi:hypothetical protein